MRLFATEIFGTEVRTADGKRAGKIDDIVIDTGSGEIVYLLLKDCSDVCDRYKKDQNGRRIVSVRTMDLAGDHIIVSL